MKRALLSLLLMSTIMSNVAWAWASHADFDCGSSFSDVLSVDESNVPTEDHKTFHEHYCSHGWAHLLGFPPEHLSVPIVSRDRLFFDAELNIVSEITPPPSKPPRV